MCTTYEVSCVPGLLGNAEVGCLRYGLGEKITLRPIMKPVKEHGVLPGLARQSHDFYLVQTINQ